MSACMKIPVVPAAVYLVLQITPVSLMERMVCGWCAHFQVCLLLNVCLVGVHVYEH